MQLAEILSHRKGVKRRNWSLDILRGRGNQKEKNKKEESWRRWAGSDEQTNLREKVGAECEWVKGACKNNWSTPLFDFHVDVFFSPPSAIRTRLCEPNLVILCRLKALGVVQLLYLPGRAHTQLCLGPNCIGSSYVHQICQHSQHGCYSVGYSRESLSAAVSSDWIDLSKF